MGVLADQADAEFGQVPILNLDLSEIRPSPENAVLYGPVDPTAPDIIALARSVRAIGVQQPLLVTEDGWIVSGHRRHMAARLAGLQQVPCRVHPIHKDRDHDGFVRLLRECNRQRVKTFSEKAREAVVDSSAEDTYVALLSERAQASAVEGEPVRLRGQKTRAQITRAKEPFLQAVLRIIEARREFWPLSDRQIHYALLNDPPLRHASKPGSVYENTVQSYKALVDLLTRARLAGRIGMDVIADDTRPVMTWRVHEDVGTFLDDEINGFLKGYWRDLMQSQPNHIEIVAEKNTIAPIIQRVAEQYCSPLTIGRGYVSIPPRYEIFTRWRESGKDKLILLLISDFDPDGDEIAHSLARSMRDDFGVEDLVPIKVALTAEQVTRSELPGAMQAKKSSSNYQKFVELHGQAVFELEALDPTVLQQLLRDAIEGVIDREALNQEIEQEKQDSYRLHGLQEATRQYLSEELNTAE